MRDIVQNFIKAQNQLIKAFDCPGDYFIKPMLGCPWRITGDEDIPILSYEQNNLIQNAVIVRHSGDPMIYRFKGYTMIVAIDCVKIAFVFETYKELKP